MEFFIIIGIILIFASMQTILFKKRIEQTIPISIVGIVLIIYLTGMFDNLKLGVAIVEILAIIQIFVILYILCKEKNNEKVKEILKRIATPGVVVYIVLAIICLYTNRERIFLDYDEFTHWGVIVKNMFMFDTFGTNANSVVYFNEYPPFTAIFQYLFLTLHGTFNEGMVIVAQNILFLSIIIPVTKNIKWNKEIIKLIIIVPVITLLPMIFYENFYLDVLVDGILGVMFAIVIFHGFEKENSLSFKYTKIFAYLVMMCLTKTTGIALALLAILIILIKTIVNGKKYKKSIKKEISKICIIVFIVAMFTSIWYIKVADSKKRWDFNQYIETENKQQKDMKEVAKGFTIALFNRQDITDKNLTVFVTVLILICTNLYILKIAKKNQVEGYKYYSTAMFISILIYLISLMITYMTIFDSAEAGMLTCFNRYASTILLANAMFQALVLFDLGIELSVKKFIIILTTLLVLLPQENITERYIRAKSHIIVSKINRDLTTKIRNYTDVLSEDDSVLYIAGIGVDLKVIRSIVQYEVMPIKISNSVSGVFKSEKILESMLEKGDYTHVFVYRMEEDVKEEVRGMFENDYVRNDGLYKVINRNGRIFLKECDNM